MNRSDIIDELNASAARIAAAESDIAAWYTAKQAMKAAADMIGEWEHELCQEHGAITVGGTSYVPVRKRWRRNSDNEALVRAVLDSRLFNRETGELVEETPADRIRAVWNLSVSNARTTQLKLRNIDIDEYCETHYGPYHYVKETR